MQKEHGIKNNEVKLNYSKLSVPFLHACQTSLIVILITPFICHGTYAQVDFSIPDTVCTDESVTIGNLSRDADTYYWNFCSGNLINDPGGENFTNPGTLDGPAFIDFAEDNGQYYAFITNHSDGTLVRNYYGSNFLNTPVSENLGNFGGIIPLHAEGIQVINEGGNWYAFVVGGQREDARLLRLDFGNSLSNTPSITNLGNPGDYLDYPVDLYITNEAGNWIGFTVNSNLNTLVRFDFGPSLTDPPNVVNLGNIGNFRQPCGILPIHENGNWYIFVSNYGSSEITRLDFGSSLLSNPAATSIGDNSVLENPIDLTIIRDCENTYGFVLNRFDDIVRLVFNNGLDNPPEYTSLGEIGNLFTPHGISDVFRVGDTLYAFVANFNSTITRLYFPGCDNATPHSSADRNPPQVTYNAPGVYNINLVIDEGQPDQENMCRNIVVLDSADMSLGNDTLIVAGTSIELAPDSTYSSYLWSTGSTDRTIETDQAGIFTLTVTNQHGCVATDEIEVILDIGIPNFFTPNGDGYNDTWEIPFLNVEPKADVSVFDRFGNLLKRYKAGERSWDGTSHGMEMPTGTYWYIIEVPGIAKPYKGSVTLKR